MEIPTQEPRSFRLLQLDGAQHFLDMLANANINRAQQQELYQIPQAHIGTVSCDSHQGYLKSSLEYSTELDINMGSVSPSPSPPHPLRAGVEPGVPAGNSCFFSMKALSLNLRCSRVSLKRFFERGTLADEATNDPAL